MILLGTYVDILDNSGGLQGLCIGLYKNSRKRGAKIGDFILLVIKHAKVQTKVKKGTIQRAIVIHTKKNFSTKRGYLIRFSRNVVILADKKFKPIATRIKIPLVLWTIKLDTLRKISGLGNFLM